MEHYRNTSFDKIVQEIEGIFYVEEWLPVDEFKCLYEISSFGRVKRLGRFSKWTKRIIQDKIILPQKSKKGYLRVALRKNKKSKWRYIQRLVALAFIETIDGKPDVNHTTCDKLKNHYMELEWCTPQENNEHGFKMGLLKRGKKPKPPLKKKEEKNMKGGICKPIIDLITGQIYTSKELALILKMAPRYINRMLSEERKPNTSQYRYA